MTTTTKNTAHNGVSPAGSLTTVFTFPCRSDFWNEPLPSGCTPPSWSAYWGGPGYYSPAICPEGWTICSARWDTRQGPNVEATETAMMCAPSGYTCVESEVSYARSTTVVTFNVSSAAVPIVTRTVYNPMMQIRWASSDLCNLETHPTSSGLRHTGGCNPEYAWPIAATPTTFNSAVTDSTFTASARPPSGTDNSRPDSPPNSNQLSTGAIVGIVLGVVFGIGFLLAICFCIRRYRRRRLPATAAATATKASEEGSSVGFVPELQNTEKPVELDPFPRQQLEPAELGGRAVGNARTRADEAVAVSPMSPHGNELSAFTPAIAALGLAPGGAAGGKAEEMEKLRQQHAQLEARRRALLQIQQIEDEQAALEEKMRDLEREGK